jgi:hypothetical protein
MSERHRFYYVAKSSGGLSKLGMAYDPAARLPALRREAGEPVELVWTSPADWPSARLGVDAVESVACQELVHRHAFGEWFFVPVEVAIEALTRAMEAERAAPNPYRLVSRPKVFTLNSATKRLSQLRGFPPKIVAREPTTVIATRLPAVVAIEVRARATAAGTTPGRVIADVLRLAWDLPEPSNKQTDKAA